MEQEKGKKRRFIDKLRYKYRVVALNEQTFEERFSMRLSRMNVAVALLGVFLVSAVIVVLLVAFTPIKEYFPDFGNTDYRNESQHTALRMDTAEVTIGDHKAYLDTLRMIMNGTIGSDSAMEVHEPRIYDTLDLSISPEDSAFRREVESADQYSLAFNEEQQSGNTNMAGVFFFTPLRGIVMNSFDPKRKHYGIDVTADKDKPIYATLDGTVIFASWTTEDGYVIQVQHSHNFLSIYKHNSALLKKVGERVKAGEPIAIIGNTGESSTGPHMHFELWYEGKPVNPESLMVFN